MPASEFEIGRTFYVDASSLAGETPGEIMITDIRGRLIYYDVLWGLSLRSAKRKENRNFTANSLFGLLLQPCEHEEKNEIKFGFDELTGW